MRRELSQASKAMVGGFVPHIVMEQQPIIINNHVHNYIPSTAVPQGRGSFLGGAAKWSAIALVVFVAGAWVMNRMAPEQSLGMLATKATETAGVAKAAYREHAPQQVQQTVDDALDNLFDWSAVRPSEGTHGSTPSVWPVPAYTRISSPYGFRKHPTLGTRKMHEGMDIAAPTGSPVLASGAGVVTMAGMTDGGYGNVVVVDHGNGFQTLYGHLEATTVKVGDTLKAGDELGKVGSTGRSTGPHLHLEVRKDGKQIDPATSVKQPNKTYYDYPAKPDLIQTSMDNG